MKYEMQLTIQGFDNGVHQWKLVCNPLSRVYFGDLVTEKWHFSLLKTNNSVQLRTDPFCSRIGDLTSTLDSLIDYYRSHPMIMITNNGPAPVLLKDYIPKAQLYQVQDWYIPDLNDNMTVQ